MEQKGFTYETPATHHLITPRGTFLIRDHFATAEEAEAMGYGVYFHHEGRDVYIKPNGESEHGKHFAVVGTPFEPEVLKLKSPNQTGLSLKCRLMVYTGEHRKPLQNGQGERKSANGGAGADDLPIQVLEDKISFPWFPLTEDSGEQRLCPAYRRPLQHGKRKHALLPKHRTDLRTKIRHACVAYWSWLCGNRI